MYVSLPFSVTEVGHIVFVIVSLAPSFVSNYEVGIGVMREALQKLGFTDAEETAIGATIVKNDYNRMLKEEKREILISSCI